MAEIKFEVFKFRGEFKKYLWRWERVKYFHDRLNEVRIDRPSKFASFFSFKFGNYTWTDTSVWET